MPAAVAMIVCELVNFFSDYWLSGMCSFMDIDSHCHCPCSVIFTETSLNVSNNVW